MPALFPRWSNTAARGSLIAIAVIIVGIPLGLMAWVRTSYATGEHAVVNQPIAFDHRVHAGALRIDCRFCHSTVERTASAGLPPTTACVGCHNDAWRASPELAPVRVSLATGRPVPWNRVDALPNFVFFNHSIHVAKGVGCETCHGRVDRMAQVSQATTLSMSWCLDCHRNPSPNLRPRDAIAVMGWTPAAPRDARDSLGTRLMRDYAVRQRTSCSTCHR